RKRALNCRGAGGRTRAIGIPPGDARWAGTVRRRRFGGNAGYRAQAARSSAFADLRQERKAPGPLAEGKFAGGAPRIARQCAYVRGRFYEGNPALYADR